MLENHIRELEEEKISDSIHKLDVEMLHEGLLDKIDEILNKNTGPILRAFFSMESLGLTKWNREIADRQESQSRTFKKWHSDERWWYQG
jgi:hypothetical protein